jgi:dihydrofolate reductase
MERTVVTEFNSLDGVIQAPSGGEDFQRGGRTVPFDQSEDGAKFKLEETLQAEAVLLGRKIYKGFAAAWPSQEGEFADKFNTMPKYVVSAALQDPPGPNSMVLDGEVVVEVAKLRQRRDGDIVIHSSAQLVQTLLEYDLVDELRLMIFPKVVGLASACSATPAAPSACGLPTPGRLVTGRRARTPRRPTLARARSPAAAGTASMSSPQASQNSQTVCAAS